MSIEVGKILNGKIKSIAPFGAFAELEEGLVGLIHISEVASAYVKDINEHLTVGQEVKVKVLSVDDNGKINLSIKKAVENEEKPQEKQTRQAENWKKPSAGPIDFEDMLSKFKQESDEKIQKLDLAKKGSRRGGRR
ncbi:MAG: S1 RNA-binding domain-containing protein [Clostridia bacterium]|nr:S1 RNA-binding domain-containing protein [Clostridia bacterium]